MKIRSIKIKLSLLVILILVPLIFLQSYRINQEYKQHIEDELKASQDFAQAVSLSFVNYLNGIWEEEGAIGLAIVSNPDWTYEDIQKYMIDVVSKDNQILRYHWVSIDGIILASTNKKAIGLDVSKRQYFKRIIDGEKKVLTSLIESYIDDEILIPVSREMRVDGELKGIIVGMINADELDSVFTFKRFIKSSSFGLIDKSGRLVYRSGGPHDIPFEKRLSNPDSPSWKALKGEIVKTYGYTSHLDGSKRMGIDYPIEVLGWACFVTASADEIFSKYKTIMYDSIVVLFIVSLISLFGAFILGSRLINSINKIKHAAEEVTRGNLSIRTRLRGNDELAATSEAFNTMAENINYRITSAEEYAKLKTQFFATMSHEFKTPLNIILAAVQLIEKQDAIDVKVYRESQQKYLKMLKQNSYRLLRLINNLIDINRIEGKHITVKFVNSDIIKVVEDITLSVAEYTNLKDIDLVFDTEIEEKIMAFDPEKMERIMLNLLSNSIKYTNSGGRIEVNVYDKTDSIMISVKDTGIGIPENMLQKIFDYFTRVDTSLRRKTEGSGIGLSLVKSLVELHGGNISVISEFGKGSEFIIELPVKLIQETNTRSEEESVANIEKINIELSDIYFN
jgi:signal transduction histidine kinase